MLGAGLTTTEGGQSSLDPVPRHYADTGFYVGWWDHTPPEFTPHVRCRERGVPPSYQTVQPAVKIGRGPGSSIKL